MPAKNRPGIGEFGSDTGVLRAGTPAFGSLFAVPAGGHAVRWLPLGLFDRNGRTLYVANPRGDGRSIVQAIDVPSGRLLRSMTVAGRFTTATADYAAATLSFNGRWLALRDAMPDQADTQAIVVNTATMRVAATIRLAGRYGLDAINGDGSRLYLLKILGPQAYEVRVYDTRQGRLEAQPLREKGEADTTLRGVSWTRAWSPRGDWLFTLYVPPGRQGAFIHALGVERHAVHCIMLPDQGPAAAADLAHYTLAVAPDGSALYAVNPVLGRMVVVRGGLPYGARTGITLARRAGSPARMLTPAALSHDGGTMYVATDQGVWAVDTRALRVRATYLPGHRISSVALSRDEQRLYALQPDQDQVTALDVAGGRLLGSVTVDAAARGIERILTPD